MLTSCHTYVSAVLPRRLGGQRLDLVPVELGRAAAVLGLGVAGGAAVLVEEGRLGGKQRVTSNPAETLLHIVKGFLKY